MSALPKSLEKVIDEFSKLPGIGPKSAARLAYHFLRSPKKDATKLANSLIAMDETVKFCSKCFNATEDDICDICSSTTRDSSKLCVVEEALDVVAFEKAGVYHGKYFVLGGVISPAEGILADELRFPQLKKLVNSIKGDVEIIVATNPSLEGEATANYIYDMFKADVEKGKVSITRLAMGLPLGADLEYADQLTLKRALEGRRKI
ncbi:recombination mediator RecR [Candidatus Dojkabacteria bacterium]|jgi:recombination protein RecR|nr:recombination mediator RecR [Candidatus Dojkabacteria bacterium]